MAAAPDTLLHTWSTELKRMSVDMLTLTILGLEFFCLFHLADRPDTAGKSCYIMLPPSWAAEHWKHAIWLADHQWQILGDLSLINHLNPNPATKSCIALLKPVCYQAYFRSFRPGLCQCTALSSNTEKCPASFFVYCCLSRGMPLVH